MAGLVVLPLAAIGGHERHGRPGRPGHGVRDGVVIGIMMRGGDLWFET